MPWAISSSSSSSSASDDDRPAAPVAKRRGRPPKPGSDADLRRRGLIEKPCAVPEAHLQQPDVVASIKTLSCLLRPLGGHAAEFVATLIAKAEAADPTSTRTSLQVTRTVSGLLGEHAFNLAHTGLLCSRLCLPLRTLKRRLCCLASAAYAGSRALAASIVSAHLNMAEQGKIEVVGIFKSIAYDETPLVV